MMSITKKILILTACIVVTVSPGFAAGPPAHAVASAHPLATAAGVEILQQGGNAFDAAIAVSAALGVVEPYSSGFGGGGFWLVHRAGDGKQVMIDARETAPGLAHARMYRDAQDNVIKDASLKGPLAAGIPGLPAGLVHLAEHYGRLPLGRSLAPAKRYAEQGFEVSSRYHRLAGFVAGSLRQNPAAAEIFLQDGKPPRIGYLIRQQALAATIDAIAKQGRDGFYRGAVAETMVRESRKYGGVWSLKDMEAGADRVAVNTAAVERPQLLSEIATRFGAQCAVLAVDAGAASDNTCPSGFEVLTHSGGRRTGLDAADWSRRAAALGAGEILLTSFDRDGTRSGYDLALIGVIREAVPLPIVASGGGAHAGHMCAAVEAGADAVLAASIFHQGDWSIGRLKDRLQQLGVAVRR